MKCFEHYAVVGELSLEGRTRPAKGALSMAISAAACTAACAGSRPETNASEAAVVEELEVIPVSSLAEAAAFFAGHLDIDPVPSRLQELFHTLSHYDDDYSDVRGEESAKRALVIAAACAQPVDARPAGLRQKGGHATTVYHPSCRPTAGARGGVQDEEEDVQHGEYPAGFFQLFGSGTFGVC